MKVIISPAKNLRQEILSVDGLGKTEIFFEDEVSLLDEYLFSGSVKEANEVWKVSENLANETFDRYIEAKRVGDKRAALELYNGAVYKNLEIESLPKKSIEFLQEHLLIVSAYYGLLEPNSYILPYRLEMDSKIDLELNGEKISSLYDFWGNKVSKKVEGLFADEDKKDKVLINLASQNYAKLVLQNLTEDIKVHEVLFYSLRKDKQGKDVYKNIATIAKIQRGKFLRFIAENEIDDVKGLEKYSEEGFGFDKKKSVDGKLVFVRDDR